MGLTVLLQATRNSEAHDYNSRRDSPCGPPDRPHCTPGYLLGDRWDRGSQSGRPRQSPRGLAGPHFKALHPRHPLRKLDEHVLPAPCSPDRCRVQDPSSSQIECRVEPPLTRSPTNGLQILYTTPVLHRVLAWMAKHARPEIQAQATALTDRLRSFLAAVRYVVLRIEIDSRIC
jgi:hypothetical protein